MPGPNRVSAGGGSIVRGLAVSEITGPEEDKNGGAMERTMDEEIQASLVNGKLPCPQAFRIAKKFKVAPREVGDAANRLQIKICNCQLGLFP